VTERRGERGRRLIDVETITIPWAKLFINSKNPHACVLPHHSIPI
jgi:hypothetical protein